MKNSKTRSIDIDNFQIESETRSPRWSIISEQLCPIC